MRYSKGIIVQVALIILSLLMSISSSAASKTDKIISDVQAQIRVGMSRVEVDDQLKNIPVTYVYVSGDELRTFGLATLEGKAVAGVFDILGPFEPQLVYMRQAHIKIFMDEHQSVMSVQVNP